MIWELNACAKQRPSCKKPVKHISLSFAPADSDLLDQTILDIASAVIKGLGYDDNQYLVVRHDRNDPRHDRTHEHDHFHILINMINLEGKRVRDNHDKGRLEKILRRQELKHKLTIVPDSNQRKYKAATTGQIQRMMREIEECQTGKRAKKPDAPYTLKIQSGIDLASHDRPSLSVFLARLQRLGIDPKLRIEKGLVKGISYRLQDFKVRGCKLYQASLPQLLEHRVEFDPQQDLAAIELANKDEEIKLEAGLEVSWSLTNIRDYVPRKMKRMLDETRSENKLEMVDERAKKTIKPEPKLEPERDVDRGWEID